MLKAADMTVQSTQLLHLAEETSDLAQDGGLSKDTTDNVWDAKFNRIKNLLDPTDPGDAVTLNYITKNQDSLLTQLRNTGVAQNSSIVSTGDSQNARLNATGDNQNTRLNTTGDTQDKRLNDLGQKYVDLMTTLKDTATTKATEASNSAELSKKWAMSSSSPDDVSGNKSSKTWAEEAKTSASNSAASASASRSSASASSASATQSANSASASKSSASAASSSASNASTSATNAKVSETNAANSAKAAKQSEENAKTWDPTQYVTSVTESNGKVTVIKGNGESTAFNAGMTASQLTDFFYPIGSVYVSADKSKTKADFPFMAYGTWEEVPANLCLQTGSASEAGGQRSAGLPNITGGIEIANNVCINEIPVSQIEQSTKTILSGENGAFKHAQSIFGRTARALASGVVVRDVDDWRRIVFDASASTSIYGSSNTVQPPAYMIRAWVRTA